MPHRILLAALALSLCGFGQRRDLVRGTTEISGFVGSTAETSQVYNSPRFGGGAEVAYGLSTHWAVTGNYTVGSSELTVFCITGPCPSLNKTIHQFLGGVRFSWPNRSVFTPYLTGTLGSVKFNAPSRQSVKFASGIGAGVDIAILRNAGILLDLRGIKPTNYPGWLVRGSTGVYFRF